MPPIVLKMGSLRSRIKATLLRRDSQSSSPGSSKDAPAEDYTQPGGYNRLGAHNGHRVCGSRSLSQEPASKRASSLFDSSNSYTHSSGRHARAHRRSCCDQQGHYSNGDHTNGSGSSTPRGPGSACIETTLSSRSAPQSQAHPDPPAATPKPASDLHSLAPVRSSSTIATQTTATPATTATAATITTNNNPVAVAGDGNNVGNHHNNYNHHHNSGSTTLPGIHAHPATPLTLSPATLTFEVLSFEPPNLVEDDTVELVDEYHRTLTPPLSSPVRPPLVHSSRRQSVLPAHHNNLGALLNGHANGLELDATDEVHQYHLLSDMVTRKIWVKRPMASATLISVNESDVVDDVREQILRKYANSLGRQYDAPDLTLRICSRDQQASRPLQPDESIVKVIDSYYPNNQTVDDALLIDIPSRRTPKASPNPKPYTDERPHESGTDYFPPYPPPPHSHHSTTTLTNGQHALPFPPSMSILSGSQLPPLPSPGSTRRLALNTRPNPQRMHTASPVSTVGNGHSPQMGAASSTGTHKYPRPARSRTHSGASSDQSNHQPVAPPISTPPPIERTATPPPRVSSPRPFTRTKKKRGIEPPSLPPGLLDNTVPPINILIVEDNIINLRLLEAFVKRLKVRWQTAVNGKEAVDKWRAGGFHLVLMDIQLPIMSGLEATREIRRIEKVNSIGVFSSSASKPPDEVLAELAEEDKLANTEMFKSPVIIVALTASSLQSDRHEALAAGCNDFLTKPVNFDWLERKVKEWGCMQALIDFDGWRKWKDFSQKTQVEDTTKKVTPAGKAKPVKKSRVSTTIPA